MSGSAIIEAIESGLGMMGALVGEFVQGFSALVWVPAATEGSTTIPGHLTDFALWALIFLGVSVTFAVVSLVLNLVRNNTGA